MLLSHPSVQRADNPSPDEPEGIPQERVDPAILYLLNQLFPGQHGIAFLAQILRLAETKQLALPELGLPENTDVAVITVQSLRVLAKLVGFSYDTVEKYIVVLSRLRLLSKKRFRNQIVLHFPLCFNQYQLAEPEALDSLVDYRPKVQSFARQVKRRFVLIRHNGQLTPAISVTQVPTSQSSLSHTATPLLNDIHQIVAAEVDSDTASRLYSSIARVIYAHYITDTSRHSIETVDSVAVKVRDQSRHSIETVDSVARQASTNWRLSHPKGDSNPKASLQKSPVLQPKGDSCHPPIPKNGRLFAPTEHGEQKKGDSDAREQALNVNVISTVISKLNVNVGNVASYLCLLFGETPKKQGYYKNLFTTQHCTNSEVWLAATIVTLQALSRKRSEVVKNPGAYFCRLCVQLHREGIPDHTLQLTHQYGALTYTQLQQQLQQSSASSSAPTPAKQQGSCSRPRGEKLSLRLERPTKDTPALSRQDFFQVIEHLKTQPNTRHMRSVPYQQADGSILLLVEDYLGHQRWIWSREEWHRCSSVIERSIWPSNMKKSSNGNYHIQEGGTY